MLSTVHPFAHQSPVGALAGCWRLAAGRALTLRPDQAGCFALASGRVWATFDGPHAGALNDRGDRVLEAGDVLDVAAGQRLVIEAWSRGEPACFAWDVAVAPAAAVTVSAVHEALADLRHAAALGASALGRLLAGVAGLALDRLTRPGSGLRAAEAGR